MIKVSWKDSWMANSLGVHANVIHRKDALLCIKSEIKTEISTHETSFIQVSLSQPPADLFSLLTLRIL